MKRYSLNTAGETVVLDPTQSLTAADGNRYPPSAFTALSEDELGAIGVTVEEVEPVSATAVHVSQYAEILIDQGTQINGIQFKTDLESVSRLKEMLDGFDAGLPEASAVKAITSAGVLLELDSRGKVEALYHAAIRYRAGIVTRSAEIQQLPVIPDPSNGTLWDLTKPLADILSAEADPA
ncbi:hypothetical protein [Pseudovibrio sp. Tun.PSC04-5.I4]|uniref:hypothetical protein n=1 Tax=Pseudovibrio sp. Tun.PSC04-5.I4 TaxID=1798213 RepID=UPI00088751BC|nr:hypothetical protein [Pseudovibrio sp. Tun.PSC04-5.I4]SDQ99912.1 hypothetical protein SAMN04515695_2244 [Pseudovibrio sp. Tun.PSC04-5.I4]